MKKAIIALTAVLCVMACREQTQAEYKKLASGDFLSAENVKQAGFTYKITNDDIKNKGTLKLYKDNKEIYDSEKDNIFADDYFSFGETVEFLKNSNGDYYAFVYHCGYEWYWGIYAIKVSKDGTVVEKTFYKETNYEKAETHYDELNGEVEFFLLKYNGNDLAQYDKNGNKVKHERGGKAATKQEQAAQTPSAEAAAKDTPSDAVPAPAFKGAFSIQIKADSVLETIRKEKAKAEAATSHPVFMAKIEPWYKLYIGDFATKAEANAFLPEVKSKGYKDAWVVGTSAITGSDKNEIAPGVKLPPTAAGYGTSVWGWSKTGNVAISHSLGPSNEDYFIECLKFFIMNVVTNKTLFSVSFCSNDDPDLGEEFKPQQVYGKKAAEIAKALKAHNIEPLYTELRQFPFKLGGFEYSAHIKTSYKDGAVKEDGEKVNEYKIIIGKDKSEKVIAGFDDSEYFRILNSIDGYFLDPYANRILVVSTTQFMMEDYRPNFDGCDLEKGFAK